MRRHRMHEIEYNMNDKYPSDKQRQNRLEHDQLYLIILQTLLPLQVHRNHHHSNYQDRDYRFQHHRDYYYIQD